MSKKSIRKTGKQLRTKRNADYRLVNDMNKAVYANLLKSGKGSRKRLTRTNEHTMAKIAKLQDRMDSAGRRTMDRENAHQEALGDAGGMLANTYSRSNRTAKRGINAAEEITNAGANAAGQVAEAGDTMLKTARAGAKEAQAGADFYASQAMSSRTSEDIRFLAQLRHDEAVVKMQEAAARRAAEYQAELARKQTKFEAGLLEKQIGSQTFQAVKPFAELLTSAAQTIVSNTDLDWEAMLAQLDKDGIVDVANPQEVSSVKMLFGRLHANNQAGPEDIAEEIAYIMRNGVPGWETLGKGKKDQLRKYIAQHAKAAQAAYESGGSESGSSEPNFIEDILGSNVPGSQGAAGFGTGELQWDDPAAEVQKLMDMGFTREQAESLINKK